MPVYIFVDPVGVRRYGRRHGVNLPARVAPWASCKSVELNRDKRNPGVGPGECLDDIEKHGCHITDAHVRIADQVV